MVEKRVALIVPCFNEEQRFPKSYWRAVVEAGEHIHWIFVNDGSTDATSELLNDFILGTSAKLIDCRSNLGKGNAIRAGILSVLESNPEVEIFGYVDSDGAFSKDDILRLTNQAISLFRKETGNPFDAYLSSRVALAGHEIHRKSTRHYIGRFIATFLTISWEDAPYDTQSGFKLFRNSSSFRSALLGNFTTRWFVDIELLTRIGNCNGGALRIWEEPLYSWRDVGDSRLSLRKAPALMAEIFIARRNVVRLNRERKSINGSH